MVNKDLIELGNEMTENRMQLQQTLDNTEESNKEQLGKILEQTSALESVIIGYLSSEHSSTADSVSTLNTNQSSELHLSRLVYIRAKTLYMQESLEQCVSELYENLANLTSTKKEKSAQRKEIAAKSEFLLNLSYITNEVGNDLESAKRLDRLKFRNNNEAAISNWEHTARKLKSLKKNLPNKDQDYINRYDNMLTDLDLMIRVLSLF